jgi:arylsulfatase A-like enzyme
LNDRQQMTLLSGVVAAVLLGALVGLLDFALFELQGGFAGFREYVLYKPGLFGLSLWLFQLMAFGALGVLCFCLFSLLRPILRKLPRQRGALPILPLSMATVALGMIALRVYMNSRQPFRLVVLVVVSGVVVFYGFVVQRSHLGLKRAPAARVSLSTRLHVLVLGFLILASFLSPDVYSGYLRGRWHPGKEHLRGPNVLFMVLDAVRADHLSCYGYQGKTTPNIDRISREGALFVNAFSAAPWTVPSHASMFTGLYPSQHQADWGHVYLDRSFPTLAERLRDIGYQTVGFSENVFVGHNFGLARGFDEFHEAWRRPLVVRAIAKIATRVLGYKERLEYAERSVGIFERWLSNNNHREKPFLAFLNLMAAHLPRYPRPAFGSGDWPKESLARIEPVNLIPERYYLPGYKLNQQELAIMVDIYDSEISYLDSQIGDLISFLAKAGILDETILVLTSDHGENFGEHGLIEHQFCLYDTLLHVPLILRYPALLKPERVETRVSTVFLAKTVMALVGAPERGGSENPQVDPLGPLRGQEFVIAECGNGVDMLRGAVGDEGRHLDFSMFDRDLRCVIEDGYKFIWSSNGRNELYRIGEDPGEAENVIEKEHDRARALDQFLRSWELSTPKKLLF